MLLGQGAAGVRIAGKRLQRERVERAVRSVVRGAELALEPEEQEPAGIPRSALRHAWMNSYQPTVNPLSIAIRVAALRSGTIDASSVAVVGGQCRLGRREVRMTVVILDGHSLMPVLSTTRVPGVSSGALYRPLRSGNRVVGGLRNALGSAESLPPGMRKGRPCPSIPPGLGAA
jgi:hypothetical protein